MMNTNWAQNKVAGLSNPQLKQGIKNTAPGGAAPNPMTQLLELAAKNERATPPPATAPTTTVAQDVEAQSQQKQEQQQFQEALQMSPQVLAAALQAKQGQQQQQAPQPQGLAGLAGLAQPQAQPAAPEAQAQSPSQHPLDKGVGGLDNGIAEDSYAAGGIIAFSGTDDSLVKSTPGVDEEIADMERYQAHLEELKALGADPAQLKAQEETIATQARNLSGELRKIGDTIRSPAVRASDALTTTPAAAAPKSDAAPRANRGPGIANTPRSKHTETEARFPLLPVPEDSTPAAQPVPAATSPEEIQANEARNRVISSTARNQADLIDKEIASIAQGPQGSDTVGAINHLLQRKAAILTGSSDEKNSPAGIKTLLSDKSQEELAADRARIQNQFRADIGVNPQVAIAEARHKKAGERIDADEKNAVNSAIRDFGFAMMADPGGQKSRGIGGALRGTLTAAARSAPAGLASWKATTADVQKRRADLGALEDQLAASKRAEDMAVVQFGYSSQEAEKARQQTKAIADGVAKYHAEHTAMTERGNKAHDLTLKQGQTLTYNAAMKREQELADRERASAGRARATEYNTNANALRAGLQNAEKYLSDTRKAMSQGNATQDDVDMARESYNRISEEYSAFFGKRTGAGTNGPQVVGSYTPGVGGGQGSVKRH